VFVPHPGRFDGYKRAFDQIFGPAPRCSVCAIGIEPNPRHIKHQKEILHHIRSAGGAALILQGAASSVGGATQTFHTLGEEDFDHDQGATVSSLAAGLRVRKDRHTNFKRAFPVDTIDLADVILKARNALSRTAKANRAPRSDPRRIMVKLDIESSEYLLLPHLVVSQAVCTVDKLIVEWHSRFAFADPVVRASATAKGLDASETGGSVINSFARNLEKWVTSTLAQARHDCKCSLTTLSGGLSGGTPDQALEPWLPFSCSTTAQA